MTIQYFAYGSNMLSEWLRRRCPSAIPQGVASVANSALSFSKQSKYGSGKATIEQAPGGRVYGVVFELQESDLVELDAAEGPGYDRDDNFPIKMEESGQTVRATTYVAKTSCKDSTLLPCDWYLDLIVTGARQHGLPHSYVEEVEATPAMVDHLLDRSGGREALGILLRHRRGSDNGG